MRTLSLFAPLCPPTASCLEIALVVWIACLGSGFELGIPDINNNKGKKPGRGHHKDGRKPGVGWGCSNHIFQESGGFPESCDQNGHTHLKGRTV